jgi:hypothetical protein
MTMARRPTTPDRRTEDQKINQLRDLLGQGKNKSEIREAMRLGTNSAVGDLLAKLMIKDKKFYDMPVGGKVQNELKIGTKMTMTLSKSKLERFDWLKEGDKFIIEPDGRNIVLRYIETDTPQIP